MGPLIFGKFPYGPCDVWVVAGPSSTDGISGGLRGGVNYERTSFRIPKSISYPNRKAQRLIP